MDAMEMNKMINDNWQMEKAMVKQKFQATRLTAIGRTRVTKSCRSM